MNKETGMQGQTDHTTGPQSAIEPVAPLPVQAQPDLHNAIMNLPCKPVADAFSSQELRAYKEGHRDARHAAAELAAAAESVQVQAHPVAGDDELIIAAVERAKVLCVHPTADTTRDIGRAVLAAERARVAATQPAAASERVLTRMSTDDEAREYLVTFMETHFSDKTFHRYIRGPLAGDFAWQMAQALVAANKPAAPAAGQALTPHDADVERMLDDDGEASAAQSEAEPEDDDQAPLELADLLDAPQLYTQVYIAARVIHEWPNDAALDAAGAATKDYGNSPCSTVDELESVLREVLRTDGDPAAPTTKEG